MTDTLFPVEPAETTRIVSTRPISFTAESIHGIEKDLKTQTRRTMYPQPKGPGPIEKRPGKNYFWDGPEGYGDLPWKCPYGTPGDRLWVREVWALVEPYETGNKGTRGQESKKTGSDVIERYNMPFASRLKKEPELLAYWRKRVVLLADFPGLKPEECGRGASDNKWRSPVTMPQWASRLLLEVTEIRAEQVQAISEEDARAEGAEPWKLTAGEIADAQIGDQYSPQEKALFKALGPGQSSCRFAFQEIWDSINGQKNPWAANPWVWCVSFRRIASSC